MDNFEIRMISGRPRKIEIYEDFLENEELTIYEVMTYIALKKYANGANQCTPSMETIAKVARASVTTTKKAIKGLINKGYLISENRYDAEKGQLPNLYTVLEFAPSEIEKIKKIREEQKKVLADNHEDKDNQNINNNSITNNSNTEVKPSQVKINPVDENICKVREIVQEPLKDSEIKTILKIANNDLEVIKTKYEVAKAAGNVKKMGAWLVTAIKENWHAEQDTTTTTSNVSNHPNKAVSTYNTNKNTNHTPKASNNRFNVFPQRDYTKEYYSDLEQALLNRQ